MSTVAALGRLLLIPATLGVTAAGLLTAGVIIAGIGAVAALSIMMSYAYRAGGEWVRNNVPGGGLLMDSVDQDARSNRTMVGAMIWTDDELDDIQKIFNAGLNLFR